MVRKFWVAIAAIGVGSLGIGMTTAMPVSASPLSLGLSQSAAFTVLGHSCGGIQEQIYATGFDATGHPVGDAYLLTRCGGSGRGGGYKTTTYTAWAAVTWDLGGNTLTSSSTAAPVVDPAFSTTDAYGNLLYNSGGAAYLVVAPAGTPTGVAAATIGSSTTVSWTSDPTTAPMVTSSTVTAVAVGSTAATVTATAAGPATSAVLGLAPATTYSISVVSTTAGGTSAASSAIDFTTPAATTPPTTPTSVKTTWTAGNTAIGVTWVAPTGGDSPIDAYEVNATAKGTTTVPAVTISVAGPASGATVSVSTNTYDWSVKVRAHNASGWGPWSKAVTRSSL